MDRNDNFDDLDFGMLDLDGVAHGTPEHARLRAEVAERGHAARAGAVEAYDRRMGRARSLRIAARAVPAAEAAAIADPAAAATHIATALEARIRILRAR
jgi:hypothetical protein